MLAVHPCHIPFTQTNIQLNPTYWYNITFQVDQGSAATTTKYRELIDNFKGIGYNGFITDTGHNFHQVRGEIYLKVPK